MWKKPAKNSYEIHNQPIRKANDCGKYIIRPIRDTNDCTLKWWAISARFSVKTKWRKTRQHSRIRSPCGVDKIWIGPDKITDLIRSNLDLVDAALLEGTIDDFIDEQENRNTRAKTDRDVNLLKTSLQRKIELRNVEEMPPFFFFRFYKLYIYFNSPGPLWIPASLLNGLPWLKVTYLLTPAQLNEMLSDFALSVRAKDGNDYEGWLLALNNISNAKTFKLVSSTI